MPSNLCLDAPLIAVGWACLISVGTTGDYPSLYKTGGLFLAVWGIYLFDRIYDSFRLPLIKSTPSRHTFAKKCRPVLVGLGSLVALATGLTIVPHLEKALIKLAIFPAILCLLYFVIFRFLKWPGENPARRIRFPAKELMIGIVFASGVMIAADSIYLAISGALVEIGLAALFAANCLIIGRAEHEFDRETDGASFYSHDLSANWVPTALLLVAIGIGVTLLILGLTEPVGIALIACALLQLAIHRRSDPSLTQPGADGVLLLPWLMLLLFG